MKDGTLKALKRTLKTVLEVVLLPKGCLWPDPLQVIIITIMTLYFMPAASSALKELLKELTLLLSR